MLDDTVRTGCRRYFLSNVQIKDYNVTIDGKKFFNQPVNSDMKTYDNIGKIATDQWDDYTTGSFLDYPYFKDYYKLIAIDISRQQPLDPDPKAKQHINFTKNLN